MTRAVRLEDLSHLVQAPPRAYLSYVAEGVPDTVRVVARLDADRWLIKLPSGTSIPDGTRVVLLIDEGKFYFELRGIRVRGTLREAKRRNAGSCRREDHLLGLRLDEKQDAVTERQAAALVIDDARVRHALRSAMIARIATVAPSGGPLIMPLYFTVLDGRMYMNNAATSPTVRNIATNPYVLVLLEGRDREVVRIRGTARYVRDAPTARRVVRASIPKYLLRPRALLVALRNLPRIRTRSRYTRERADTGMIEITPVSYEVSLA